MVRLNSRDWPALTRVVVGVGLGIYTVVIIGFLQALAFGINLGFLLDVRLQVAELIVPSSSGVISLVALVAFVFLFLIGFDFVETATFIGFVSVVILATLTGQFIYERDFITDPGASSWLAVVVISASQSLATPLALSFAVAAKLKLLAKKKNMRASAH